MKRIVPKMLDSDKQLAALVVAALLVRSDLDKPAPARLRTTNVLEWLNERCRRCTKVEKSLADSEATAALLCAPRDSGCTTMRRLDGSRELPALLVRHRTNPRRSALDNVA